MNAAAASTPPARPERNRRWVDLWSLTHIAWGAAAAWLLGPWVGFVAMALWEPLEIFVLSPLLARVGITFGYEGWQNSVGDLAFNAIGVALVAWVWPRVG